VEKSEGALNPPERRLSGTHDAREAERPGARVVSDTRRHPRIEFARVDATHEPVSRENRDTPAPAKTISLSFRGGHLTKTSGKRCPRCAPSRARANAYPPDPLRCVVRTVRFRALHLVGAEFTRSIAPTTRVFDRGHNPAFPSFRANPLQVCFCGPRNAV
jgi:hypothetical protein